MRLSNTNILFFPHLPKPEQARFLSLSANECKRRGLPHLYDYYSKLTTLPLHIHLLLLPRLSHPHHARAHRNDEDILAANVTEPLMAMLQSTSQETRLAALKAMPGLVNRAGPMLR